MPFENSLWTQTHSLKIYKYPRIIRIFGFWDRIGLDRIGVLHSTDRMGSDTRKNDDGYGYARIVSDP